MGTLYLGIVLFLGAHLFTLLAKPARAGMATRLGEGPYKIGFALVSLVGLGLMIWGLVSVRSDAETPAILYEPPSWGRHAAMLLVLLAFVSLAISFHKGKLKLLLKHPMSLAFGLWALGHLLANGGQAEVLFFGAFLFLAVLDIVISTARGKVPTFAPKPRHDLISIVAGVVLYVVFLYLHPILIGAPVL